MGVYCSRAQTDILTLHAKGCDIEEQAVRLKTRETWESFSSREKEMKERVHKSLLKPGVFFMRGYCFFFLMCSTSRGY